MIPAAYKNPPNLSAEKLAVRSLAPGTYELKIDGAAVGRWTDAELAAGIDLGENPKTPQYQQALEVAMLAGESFRDAVVSCGLGNSSAGTASISEDRRCRAERSELRLALREMELEIQAGHRSRCTSPVAVKEGICTTLLSKTPPKVAPSFVRSTLSGSSNTLGNAIYV